MKLGTWHTHEASAPHRSARWAMSDRGWLFVGNEPNCRGRYLDYGPNHYRSPHEYCLDGRCECELSQPGKVHAVSVNTRASRYFVTVNEAKAWIQAQSPDVISVREKFAAHIKQAA